MADDTNQRAVHRFFTERLRTLEPFTKDELLEETGWTAKSLETYWPKQLKGLVEDLGNGRYRMRERFRLYAPWKKFQQLVTQVRTVPPTYAPTIYEHVVVYEFYLPLAHEAALRLTLDSMFYSDALLPRLKRIGAAELAKKFERPAGQTDVDLLASVLTFIDKKVGGYSIYHVDGRFRAGKLCTQDEAFEVQKSGGRYLVDETTAVVRFVFPVTGAPEAEKVRLLFEGLFMNAITEQVSGEDEIWVVETGMRNRVSVWKPKNG